MNNNLSSYFDICEHLIHNMLNSENDIQNCIEETQNALENVNNKETTQITLRITRQIASSRAMHSYRIIKTENSDILNISSILEELDVASTLTDTATTENILGLQISDALDKYIRSLSSDEISIYIRRYFYGESISDISKALNTTSQKIKQTLHHCNSEFNSILSDKGYIVSSETLFLSFTDIDDDIIDLKLY